MRAVKLEHETGQWIARLVCHFADGDGAAYVSDRDRADFREIPITGAH
jgi:hypothetical protein